MDIIQFKQILKIISSIFALIVDLVWVIYSMTDWLDQWWDKTSLIVTLILVSISIFAWL